MPRLRERYAFFIYAPGWEEGSGGVRALHLLCHLLNQRGFRAFMVTHDPKPVPPALRAPLATTGDLERARREGIECVPIYPEVTVGNPFGGRFVIRFLLNRPGMVTTGGVDASTSYGPDDVLLAFDPGHAPVGRQAHDMFLPLVDRSTYHRPPSGSARSGFVVCSKRPPAEVLQVPGWMTPITFVTPSRPRTHVELGTLYRQARGMIAYGRSTAIYEALCCGCPVLGIPSRGFDEGSYQPRFGGAGMAWRLTEAALGDANRSLDRFEELYSGVEAGIASHVERTFSLILRGLQAASASPAKTTA